MSSRPLRFLQAGDFLLHQPMQGLMDVPEHLASRLIDAPYRAAERVFDAAIAENVDFVILAGNLCDARRSGPRGPVFLLKQFSRLAEAGVAVYWAAGEADRSEDWPEQLRWPPNVHIFPSNRVERNVHHRDGTPLCQIAGRSAGDSSSAIKATGAYAANPDGLFAIAVTSGDHPRALNELPAIGNHYWACGGASQTATPLADSEMPCTVHFAGSPQGRLPHDLDPGGCTLVEVETNNREKAEPHHRVRLTRITTNVVRWHDERLLLPASLEQAEYERLLHERIGELIARDPGVAHLIRWNLEGVRSSAGGLNQSALAANLLAALRSEYGFRDPPAWSAAVELVPPELPATWCEQQTLLGEFLRRIGELKTGASDEMEFRDAPRPAIDGYFDCFLSQSQLTAGLAAMVELHDAAAREGVLRRASALGAELLAPSMTGQRGDSSRTPGNSAR